MTPASGADFCIPRPVYLSATALVSFAKIEERG
jgi:hypothetical protein